MQQTESPTFKAMIATAKLDPILAYLAAARLALADKTVKFHGFVDAA